MMLALIQPRSGLVAFVILVICSVLIYSTFIQQDAFFGWVFLQDSITSILRAAVSLENQVHFVAHECQHQAKRPNHHDRHELGHVLRLRGFQSSDIVGSRYTGIFSPDYPFDSPSTWPPYLSHPAGRNRSTKDALHTKRDGPGQAEFFESYRCKGESLRVGYESSEARPSQWVFDDLEHNGWEWSYPHDRATVGVEIQHAMRDLHLPLENTKSFDMQSRSGE